MSAKLCKYTYFYIHDHLGSTSMVLDADGNISQSVTYIPYGEIFVEERNGAWNSPYLFNSKELDEETGLYYYGARYLNPTSAVWMSVDPMWEKFLDATPYNYCHGNPIRMIDPDGREEKENKQYDKRKTLSQQETGFSSVNNLAGSAFSGASAEPLKGFCSESDLKVAEENIKNAKNGSGLTAESCMEKGGAKYYHMSASASRGVRIAGTVTKGLGYVSVGTTVVMGVCDIANNCESNLSSDDLILSNWTTGTSAVLSIVGGYAGTAVGFAAGAETGPGALVTAALAGYIGTEVGEKLGYGLGYVIGKGHILLKSLFE